MGSADRWSYVAGEKGRNRVRAFEKSNSSNLYLEFSERDPETGEWRKRRISAQTSDKAEAKQKADQLAGQFAEGTEHREREDLRLETLFHRYVRERGPDVSEQRRTVYGRVSEAMRRYFGDEQVVSSLNRTDWDQYVRDRSTGVIDSRGHEVPEGERKPVGARAVREDLEVLRGACNWAVQADLLDVNPTEGYPLPREKNPTRPRISDGRYRAMLEVADEVDWRFKLALVLAHETGHRSKAIRLLRWSDVDLSEATIRWRAEADKTGHEHVTPLTDAAITALREARGERAGIGNAWMFPAPRDPSKPCSRNIFRDWWNQAEELAGLEPVDGLGWHSLRRKFADELRDAPLKDLANLGGWKTERTILQCYQGESLEAMREAQKQRQPLEERA